MRTQQVYQCPLPGPAGVHRRANLPPFTQRWPRCALSSPSTVDSADARLLDLEEIIVITFNFEPVIQLAGLSVRLETVGVAASIGLMVALSAVAARRAPDPASAGSAVASADVNQSTGDRSGAHRSSALEEAATDLVTIDAAAPERLLPLDLVLITLGTIPGAFIAGRLGYVLVHLDYYVAQPGAWLDLGRGGLELGTAVVGGALTAMVVARSLTAPVEHWLHVAAAPLLLGLGLGKAAMALGGDGQGLPSDAPWATSYQGAGPWGSLASDIPSHPAQLYEGVLTLAGFGILVVLGRRGRFARRDGQAFLAAVYMWFVARTVAAFYWRDPPVIGPLGSTQLMSIAIGLVALGLWLSLARRRAAPRS